jgi:hypothetical protein
MKLRKRNFQKGLIKCLKKIKKSINFSVKLQIKVKKNRYFLEDISKELQWFHNMDKILIFVGLTDLIKT